MKYGMLTITREFHRNGRKHVEALCDCGETTVVRLSNLVHGGVKSCGCLLRNQLRTHGESGTRLHQIWKGMWQRCTNPNQASFKNYGGRGITVCSEWKDFAVFRDWAVSHGYMDSLSLDRQDNNQGYNPDNCRFATRSQQSLNQRRKSNNSSGFIGVDFHKQENKWRARVQVDKRSITVGSYDTAEEAGQARDEFIKRNGINSELNFPE
jgi:hypothetical protein